jgi:hypothetical protein
MQHRCLRGWGSMPCHFRLPLPLFLQSLMLLPRMADMRSPGPLICHPGPMQGD